MSWSYHGVMASIVRGEGARGNGLDATAWMARETMS